MAAAVEGVYKSLIDDNFSPEDAARELREVDIG